MRLRESLLFRFLKSVLRDLRGSAGLLFLPLLLIYVAIAAGGWSRPPADDEVGYLRFAGNLARGAYATASGPVELWSPPGYPLLLAGPIALAWPFHPFRAAGDEPGMLRLLNAPILFAAVWCFFRFLRNHFPHRAALLGAYALGLYFPLWKFLPWLMTEVLAVFLVCALLWAWSEILRRDRISIGWLAVAGIAFAWLCLTRAIFGYVLFACLVAYLVFAGLTRGKVLRRMLIAHAAAAVLCIPWLAFTYSRTGRLFYWSAAGGMQLYWMTSAAPGEWGDWQGFNEAAGGDEPAARREFFDRARRLDEVQRDQAFKAEALRNLSAQPGAYLRNIAANLSRMFFSFPYSHTPQKLSALFYALPNSFLLAFAVLALVRRVRRRPPVVGSEGAPAPRLPRPPPAPGPFDRLTDPVAFAAPPLYPCLIFAGAGLAGTALLSAYARMLFPFVPVLLLLAVYGLQPLLSHQEQEP